MARLLIGFILIVSFTLIGCTTTTNPTIDWNRFSNNEVKAYNNDPNNTDRIVCKYEAVIGSHIERRVCYKESAMRKRSRSDRQALGDLQRQSSQLGK
jgi:hypothetical protein